jgi:hypothetical protein
VPGTAERTPMPGAETLGFRRLLPSTVTEPRLLKLAIVSLAVLVVAPTLNTAW